MRRLAALAALAMVVLAGACSGGDDDAASTSTRNTTSTTVAATTTTSTTGTSTTGAPRQASVGDLVLDPDHDYGNRYADGILPVGDGKYRTDGAARGEVYVCRAPAGGGGGAGARGPWFSADGKTYDINQKVA
ncbi:MAG TPA: hypothetical protein VK549_12940, partial [Acidimicrobiia bacterium]|nr:hypothetical protein [Acidimicrobiia bacterium]